MSKFDNKLIKSSTQTDNSTSDNIILLSEKKQELCLYEEVNLHLTNYVKANKLSVIKFENTEGKMIVLFKERSFLKELAHHLIIHKSKDFTFITKLKTIMPHNHHLHLALNKLQKLILHQIN